MNRSRVSTLIALACLTSFLSARAIAAETPRPPRIQVALLLDTSSSMDGLIDQARNQLWQVVDTFGRARRGNLRPVLEVAVLEYGNSNLSPQNGYVRQVAGLTGDLDRVSEALFALTTGGGEEYCGAVIEIATRDLQWSAAEGDVRAIFIAGNEPFDQGPVSYVAAIERAKARGIVVNTVHAGPEPEGIETHWKAGALIAGGRYMSIDPNLEVAHVAAPQDGRIAELNAKLNQTYLPYGAQGASASKRQLAQDANSASVSGEQLAKRAKTKASALYESSGWDLVDAVEQDKVDLARVAPGDLPEPLRALSPEQRRIVVKAKAADRKHIQSEIHALGAERDAFVAAQRRASAAQTARSLDSVLVETVLEQGRASGFDFTPTADGAAPK
jgi:hypothetical protein